MLQRALAFIALFALCFTASACTNKNTEKDSAKQSLSTKDAQLFSRTLVVNYENKSANFTATTEGGQQQEKVLASGSVSWEKEDVELEFSSNLAPAVKIKSFYHPNRVFETYTDLPKHLAAAGFEQRTWIQRTPIPDSFRNDALSAFVLLLASPTAENPLLIRQDGTKVVGKETISGESVTVFERSGSVKYYVADDATLRRVVTQLTGFDNPLSITFARGGGNDIIVPNAQDSHLISDVENIYLAFRPGV